MKKLLLTLALVATTVASFAQGKISFANDSTRLYSLGNLVRPGDTSGPIPTSPLPSGSTLVAALYAGTTAGSLSLQTSIPLTGTSWLTAGRMATKTVILTIPGGVAQSFNIVLLNQGAVLPATIDGSVATRLANANSVPDPSAVALFGGPGAVNYYGSSGLFTAVPGTSVTYPFIYQTTSPVLSTFPGGSIFINTIPEPSSLALAGLGAASLLLFRRRK